jgi:molybdenum cofactor guanylyltransferase
MSSAVDIREVDFRNMRPVYYRGMVVEGSALTAFILAGGKSLRMGTDKAFVVVDGQTLLARALNLARSVTSSVCVVGESSKFGPFAPVVEDVFRGCGPLGGIHAALRASSTGLNLILAVDLPFLPVPLLQYLILRAGYAPTAIATVPRAADGRQPLCAIYRRGFADAAEKALREGRYKIDQLFDVVQTLIVEESELTGAGFLPSVFRNLNTRDDVEAALIAGN